MLWAIDIGNTHIVVGVYDGDWKAIWRIPTDATFTEDTLAADILTLCKAQGISQKPTKVVCANVVPALTDPIERFASHYLNKKALFLASDNCSLDIRYSPTTAVGADRLANAIAANHYYSLPAIIVDFGTATTFDAIAEDGAYLGGSILPGVELSMNALFERAAKLSTIELRSPTNAIGTTTDEALRSGIVFGYAGAIDSLANRIQIEIGAECAVVATGGLSELFAPFAKSIQHIDPLLTLNGLRIFGERSVPANH